MNNEANVAVNAGDDDDDEELLVSDTGCLTMTNHLFRKLQIMQPPPVL